MEWNRWLKRGQKALLWCFQWPLIRYWVRAGYASKGIVYFVVGFFVLRSALGNPVPIIGTEEALLVLLRQPLGTTIVTLLAAGLCGYGFWRFVQAVVDPEHDREMSLKSIGQRVGYLASGVAYTNLAYESVDFSWDSEKIDADATNEALARILSFEFGELLIAAVAITIFVIGAIYIYGAVSGEFISEFRRSCNLLDCTSYRWLKKAATYLAQVGYTARGVAILVIGVGFVRAALTSSVEPAGGMQEALQALLKQSYGTEGLVLIALGFIAYALYMVFSAFYRRFQVEGGDR
ncbi:MAG: DUF1206 domain-containing protein [Cyanobacteria bacterium P01_A01_bin.135]